ncbi:MAG: DoxX family protein [Xanthobacteraceae bacterium]
MLFFALIGALTLLAALAARLGVPGLDDWRACMRWGLAIALVFTGVDHLLLPVRYLPMLPDFVPYPNEIVALTGLCEIAGAFGLLIPRLRKLAGVMLAIYLVAVFPANIKNAIEGLSVEGLPSANWYYWARLPFQPLAVWWSLYAAAVVDWPFGKTSVSR